MFLFAISAPMSVPALAKESHQRASWIRDAGDHYSDYHYHHHYHHHRCHSDENCMPGNAAPFSGLTVKDLGVLKMGLQPMPPMPPRRMYGLNSLATAAAA
eukprot:GHVU01055891.1.p1 GENE.GHVU01055891.1~~GHVU01055891.1.p1  ORF type:complete len:100 (-),score=5.82 GHVU01055891.1:32-331(-)